MATGHNALRLNSVFSGHQVPQSGAKGTSIDVSSMAPSLCSSTTVTTVFQQPIMSPAIPPLCLNQVSHPMAKRPQEEEEVWFIVCFYMPKQFLYFRFHIFEEITC